MRITQGEKLLLVKLQASHLNVLELQLYFQEQRPSAWVKTEGLWKAKGFKRSSQAILLVEAKEGFRSTAKFCWHKIYQPESLVDAVISLFNHIKVCYPIVWITLYKYNSLLRHNWKIGGSKKAEKKAGVF